MSATTTPPLRIVTERREPLPTQPSITPAARAEQHAEPIAVRVEAEIRSSVTRESTRRELEVFLQASLGMPVHLTVTDNRRNLFSWRRATGHVALRLHHMFLSAADEQKRALAAYLSGSRGELRTIRSFMRDNMHHVRPVAEVGTEQARGQHHDLRALFDTLNRRYFEGRCDASIAWGKLPPRRRRRRSSMRLGSYTLGDAAIRIHPLLDDPRVPAFFVASVVHHEMLHHMVPATTVGGRLMHHNREFRTREREFEHYALAVRWENEHIAELLRR